MQNKKINKIILTLSCALLCLGVFGIKEDNKIYADEWTPIEITPWVITSLATAMGYRIMTSGLNSASSINSFIQDKWDNFKQTLTTTGLVLYSATLGSAKLKADNIANGQIIDFLSWLKENNDTTIDVSTITMLNMPLKKEYTTQYLTADYYALPLGKDYILNNITYPMYVQLWTSNFDKFLGYQYYINGTDPHIVLFYKERPSTGPTLTMGYYRENTHDYFWKTSNTYSRNPSYTRLSDLDIYFYDYSMSKANWDSVIKSLDYSDFVTFSGTLGYNDIKALNGSATISGAVSDSFPQRKEVEWELKDEVITGDTTIDQIKDIINNGVISNTLADIITLTGQIADDIGAQTGLLTDIKEGINSLVDTFQNIWAIDNDYITTSINNTLTNLQSHTGLLTYPVSLTIEFLNMCNNISANDFILTFPSLPIIENEEKTFNVSAMVRNNNSFNTFYNTYVTILDGIIAFWLVNLLWRKSKEIFKA